MKLHLWTHSQLSLIAFDVCRVEWASSVPERPMPIKVTLKGYFEYMSEDQGKVFMQAVLAKYGIVLGQNAETLSDTMKATHFGVFTVNAVPISSYSNTAISNYRTLMSTNFPTISKKSDEKLLLVPDDSAKQKEEGDDVSWKATAKCPAGKYICGIRTVYDECPDYAVTDELGITMIDICCCTKEGDDAKPDFEYFEVKDRYEKCLNEVKTVLCPDKSWIVGFEGRSYSYRDAPSATDPEGVNGLRIFCSDNPTKPVTVEAGRKYGNWNGAKFVPDGR